MRAIKIYLTIIVICILSFLSYGQTKWTIGVNAGPNISRNITYKSKDLPTYHIGINTNYLLTEKLFLTTGINYSKKRTLSQGPTEIDSGSPYILILYDEVRKKDYQINVPLIANYFIINGIDQKVSFYTSLGMQLNYTYKTNYDVAIYSFRGKEEEGVNYSFLIGVGVFYKLSNNFIFAVEPRFINDFYSGNKNVARYNTLSINISLNYKLK